MSRIEQALARAGRVTEDGHPLTMIEHTTDAMAVPIAVGALDFGSEVSAEAGASTSSAAVPNAERANPVPAAELGLAPEGLLERIDGCFIEKVVVGGMSAESVEQYRRLAATLHHAQAERDLKVVMIASAVAREGKTLTAANLALTLSESYGRRVLLIDADLRRPSLHSLFRLINVTGLSDGLNTIEGTVLHVRQLSSGLAILTAGQPNTDPMSALTSDRMRQVVQEASEAYDWVLLDTPPVALMPDANLLAAMVGGAVLVVRAGTTPYPLVQRAIAAIGRERILGVVLNGADVRTRHDDYYNYYHSSRGRPSASDARDRWR